MKILLKVAQIRERYEQETGMTIAGTKIRWYHNIELIDRPVRRGKFAHYTEDDFLALVAIQFLNKCGQLRIEDLAIIRRRGGLVAAAKDLAERFQSAMNLCKPKEMPSVWLRVRAKFIEEQTDA